MKPNFEKKAIIEAEKKLMKTQEIDMIKFLKLWYISSWVKFHFKMSFQSQIVDLTLRYSIKLRNFTISIHFSLIKFFSFFHIIYVNLE